MKALIKRYLFKHWKTSIGAVYVGLFTVMLWTGKITAADFGLLIGTLITIGLFAAKDPDKVKDHE